MNNYQRIISLTLEEMAEFIKCSDCFYCNARENCKIWNEDEKYSEESCKKYAIQWLKEEY